MNETTLAKTYDPKSIEANWYDTWLDSGHFACAPKSTATPYTIMMPPPNVTGSLHMGHALTFTLQDLLIRYHRMTGHDVLWQPGTDHAGIATQMVVERQLAEQNIDRRDLGRDAFIEKVWEWKAESGGKIHKQLRRLGASADWQRDRFTMDAGLSDAVVKTFVQMHREGLIYRDKRLVNWDPKLMTAISDLEVEQIEQKSSMWHLRYRIEGAENKYISIATTRPETMLGDGAVAVNPADERYQHLIGRMAILPLSGRRIPIVADDYAKMDKGSGAVKITPAHDFNDFEVGKRHNLPLINLMTATATMESISEIPKKYQGLDRYDARREILVDLAAEGMVEREEILENVVPHGDRSGVVIEPWLLDQWYVNAEKLAQPAIKAVEEGRTKFVPERWNKTYFEWMRNIQPWCISRQLWWGHRIPAWYGPDNQIFVEASEAEAHAAAAKHYGQSVELTRDNDVLDTWFSSGLWPFSTLGWPEQTDELKRYYPGDVLVTGFDIIFFWVARMMMMGNKFMSETPFKTVYVHALVRDEKGQKMSKSKGNVIDPLEIIDKYGADTLRFTLTSLNTPGRDVRLSEQRIAGYRNFVTKITNAYKFAEFKGIYPFTDNGKVNPNHIFNIWIINEFQELYKKVQENYEKYYFHEVANQLYHFTWHTFCDWYIELSKNLLDDNQFRDETKQTFHLVFNSLLQLLHPVIPFITEKLWGKNNKDILMSHQWDYVDLKTESEHVSKTKLFIDFIEEYRSIEKLFEIKKEDTVEIFSKNQLIQTILEDNKKTFEFLTRKKLSSSHKDNSVTLPFKEFDFEISTSQIDKSKIKEKLQENKSSLEKEKNTIDKNLSNENFVSKAPKDLIDQNKERQSSINMELSKIDSILINIQ